MNVKLNAVVSDDTRKAIRHLATERDSTVQAVAALAIDLGLKEIHRMPKRTLAEMLQPDGRRKAS